VLEGNSKPAIFLVNPKTLREGTPIVKKAIVFLLGLAAVNVMFFFVALSYDNAEIELRNTILAKQKTNEASFDTMWKILKQQASIPDKYKEDFKEIWPDLIRGRYEQGSGKMMNWIQEHNPEFKGGEMYMKLMDSIEAERKRFLRDQEELVQLNTERNNMIQKKVPKFFLGLVGGEESLKPIEIVVITSEVTEQTFESGKEDNVDLFSSPG